MVKSVKELDQKTQEEILNDRFAEKPKPKPVKKVEKVEKKQTFEKVDNKVNGNTNDIFKKVTLEEEEEPDKAGAESVEFNGY